MKKRLVLICILGDPFIPAASEPLSGGFNADTAELADLLVNADYPVDIITNTSPERQAPVELWKNGNVTIYRVSVPPDALIDQDQLGTQFFEILQQVCEIWKNFPSPPFLIHSLYWYSGYLALHLSQIFGIPFLHSVVSLAAEKTNAGKTPKFHDQRKWEDAFLPKAECILAISQTERELLCTEYHLSPEKVEVVGRSVPKELFTPSHNESGTVGQELRPNPALPFVDSRWWNNGAFTYIGRMVADKGVVEIVLAWYRLYQIYGEATPPIWLVGGMPEEICTLRSQLTKILPELGDLEQAMRICWWGFLSAGALSTVLMKSLVLVHHSRFEAGGRVILEAMSTKTPVIASPYGFAKDFIRDWENGFLVGFGDIDLLKIRMSHFIRQPLLSNALGNTAYQKYQALEQRWNFGQTHLEIYRSYSTGTPWNRHRSFSVASNIENYFQKGLITSYPYTGIPISELRHLIYKKFPGMPKSPERIFNPTGHSFLWTAGGRYYIKQLYSTLNKARLWGMPGTPEATPVQLRFHRACLSASSEWVLNLIHAESEFHLLITERAAMISDNEINWNLEKAAEALAGFSNSLPAGKAKMLGSNPEWPADCKDTLAGYWSELFRSIEQTSSWGYTLAFCNCLARVQQLEEDARRDPGPLVGNYGKPVYGHCVDAGKTYKLLPSSDAFWGELGWDAGLLISCWLLWHSKGVATDFPDMLNRIAAPWSLSPQRLLNWVLLHLVTRTFASTVCMAEYESQRIMQIIQYLIELYKKL